MNLIHLDNLNDLVINGSNLNMLLFLYKKNAKTFTISYLFPNFKKLECKCDYLKDPKQSTTTSRRIEVIKNRLSVHHKKLILISKEQSFWNLISDEYKDFTDLQLYNYKNYEIDYIFTQDWPPESFENIYISILFTIL